MLNEDTQLVMRAIGASHTACKDEFRRNLRSHSWSVFSFFMIYYKNKKHSSCEIEGFVETHLCQLCVILRSHVLRVVLCVLMKDLSRRLPLQLQCSYQGQHGEISQSVRENL